MNLNEALWHKEESDDAILFGFTKEFIHEVLPEAWYVTPTKLDDEGEVKKGSPLLAVETNDELFSIVSPFSGFHLKMNQNAIHFPDQIKIDTTVATLSKKKKEIKKKEPKYFATIENFVQANAEGGGGMMWGAAPEMPAPVARPTWESIWNTSVPAHRVRYSVMVHSMRNQLHRSAYAVVWWKNLGTTGRQLLREKFRRLYHHDLSEEVTKALIGDGRTSQLSEYLIVLKAHPGLSAEERAVFSLGE